MNDLTPSPPTTTNVRQETSATCSSRTNLSEISYKRAKRRRRAGTWIFETAALIGALACLMVVAVATNHHVDDQQQQLHRHHHKPQATLPESHQNQHQHQHQHRNLRHQQQIHPAHRLKIDQNEIPLLEHQEQDSNSLPEKPQVPEQLPIVVSSSDNSYVSASPMITVKTSTPSQRQRPRTRQVNQEHTFRHLLGHWFENGRAGAELGDDRLGANGSSDSYHYELLSTDNSASTTTTTTLANQLLTTTRSPQSIQDDTENEEDDNADSEESDIEEDNGRLDREVTVVAEKVSHELKLEF